MKSTEVLLWAVTLLNFLLTSCGLWAAIMARSYLRALRLKLAQRSTRSLAQVDAATTELASTVSSLSQTMRRLSSRAGMQDVRARQKLLSSVDPQTMTKEQLRQALRTGQLRVFRDQDLHTGPAAGDAADGSAENTRHNGATR